MRQAASSTVPVRRITRGRFTTVLPPYANLPEGDLPQADGSLYVLGDALSHQSTKREPFMADQIVITEKASQAKDVRAAVGSRYGDILPAEGHLFDLLEPEDVSPGATGYDFLGKQLRIGWRGGRMDWAHILAFVTGMVDQELLARIEYLAAENRILKAQLKGPLRLSDA